MSVIYKVLFLFVFLFFSCEKRDSELEKKLLKKIAGRVDKKDAIANSFLKWDSIHPILTDVFYRDSLLNRLHYRPNFEYIESDLAKLDYEEIRKLTNQPNKTLKEYAPYLDSSRILEGNKQDLLTNYIENDYKQRNRYCFYFFSKPVFVNNKFCFIYEESFCSPENGGGQMNVYVLINGEWELAAFIWTFVI